MKTEDIILRNFESKSYDNRKSKDHLALKSLQLHANFIQKLETKIRLLQYMAYTYGTTEWQQLYGWSMISLNIIDTYTAE